MPSRADADIFIGHVHGVDEAGANGLQIEGRTAVRTETLLEQARGTWEELIGRGGRDQDQIQVDGLKAGSLQCPLCGDLGQITAGLTFGHQMALFDAGAFTNPAIRGIDDRFQLGVGHDPAGQIAPGAEDAGELHQADSLYCSVSRWRPT